MIKTNRKEAQEKIDSFFKQPSFKSEDLKKIKRLSMKFNIKLGKYRRQFCKSCLSQLKGKTRATATTKTIECSSCSFKNKFRI